MTDTINPAFTFREAFNDARPGVDADYALLRGIASAYAACTRNGEQALVIPLSILPLGAVGKRTAGCELLAHPKIRVDRDGSTWECPAAALICHDLALLGAFSVLVGDVIAKIGDQPTWSGIGHAVDEWLTLLAPRGAPSVESELGLWGELWFLTRASNLTQLLQGWRGPDGDNLDFFLDGVGAEIKTSRGRYRHYCSQSQVGAAAGNFPSWFLSIWVKPDAVGSKGTTVPVMIDQLLSHVPDPAEALRRLARAGYSVADRASYGQNLVVLEEPGWFASTKVPQVRLVDPGVSQLRYQVELHEALRAHAVEADHLWNHFHGHQYET
jgi:hypothetical protein